MATTIIEATYRVTTPMFCGGANQQDAELRLPSFKGSLRFWWRAQAWSRLNRDLKAIKKAEDVLFGSADGGQARVTMRLSAPPNIRSKPGHSLPRVNLGGRYLAYGVMERDPVRNYLEAPFDFTVHMRARDLDDEQRTSLTDALTALGVLGGMGAKSRKGFGSLALRSLTADGEDIWNAPRNIGDLRYAVDSLRVANGSNEMPRYSAISKSSRYLLIGDEIGRRPPINLLNLLGGEIKNAAQAANGIQRAAFGLPRAGISLGNVERRASPLFMHIHECGGAHIAVLSFLPSIFLDQNIANIPKEGELYRPIHGFLDDLGRSRDDVVEVR